MIFSEIKVIDGEQYVNIDLLIEEQKQNTELKEDIKNLIKIISKNCDELEATEEELLTTLNHIEELQSQLEQKEDNWNKLKKWLEGESTEYKKDSYSSEYGLVIGTMLRTLDKMQEIEGGMNDR